MPNEQIAHSDTQTAHPISEATLVLDKGSMTAQVILCPSCSTTLVIPPYDGANRQVTSCEGCGHAKSCYCTDCSCPLHGYVEAEVATTEEAEDSLATLVGAVVAEAGRRNSTKDESVLKQIVDLVKQLGVEVTPPVPAVEPVEAPASEEVQEEAAAPEVVEFLSEASEPVSFAESGGMGGYVTLREAGAVFSDEKREVIITPIRPGWGNPKDGYYYTQEALQEAVDNGVFNGRPVKMYANHPSRGSEAALPERSVWDWVSTMKETWWDGEKNRPQSRIKVYDERFWDRMKQAPDEIAFSILGGGRSRKGRVGNREARIVESLSHIRSVDWVTEAGAGGAIEKFAESAHEEFEMDLKNLTAEQLKEAAPELYEAIVAASKVEAPVIEAEAPVEPEAPVVEAEAPAEAPEVEAAPEAVVEEAPVEPVVDAVAEAQTAAIEEMRKELNALKQTLAEKELAEAVAKNKAETADFVADVIKESTLPTIAKTQVSEKFREATAGEGFLYSDRESLKVAIERELGERKALIDELVGKKSLVQGLGGSPEAPEIGVRESVERRIMDKWGAAPATASGDTKDEEAEVTESNSAVASSIAAKFGF